MSHSHFEVMLVLVIDDTVGTWAAAGYCVLLARVSLQRRIRRVRHPETEIA